MKKQIAFTILILAFLINAPSLIAQDTTFIYPSRSEISVTLIAKVEKHNENYIYNYTMVNSKVSRQSIEEFYIEYFSNVYNVSSPSNWIGLKSDARLPVVIWGSSEDIHDISQGKKLSGFSFRSKSIPSLLNFYAAGNVKEPVFNYGEAPPLESTEGLDIFENSVKGKTIGPRALPENISNSALVDTLQSYLSFSCDKTWITNQGICRSLEAKLDNVEKQLESGNTTAASGSVQAFLNEVEAQKNKQLSSEAYALLYFNGRYLVERLN